jgi:hypothetical protein
MQLEAPRRGRNDELPREREGRASEETTTRRRRQDTDTVGKRLAVNTNLLDYDKFAYRFINDAPARLFQMTQQDDWDIVKQDGGVLKPDSTDMGEAVSVVVGTKPDGSPLRSYLCRKPRKFYDDDQKKKQTELDEQLAQLRRGNTKAGDLQGDYVPSGGIRIA